MLHREAINHRHRVLLVGPSPPPFNGMSVMTQVLLENLGTTIELIHLDTADRRSISNVGRLDVVNLLLAFWHGLKFLYLLLAKHPNVVYVPISQAGLPFLRDCLFLLPAKISRIPIVVHLHGGYFSAFYSSASSATRWLIRLALGNARAVVLGESLISAFDGIIPRDRVQVVPNGIPDLFQHDVSRQLDNGLFTVLYLGLLAKEKGVFDLLRAIPLVIAKGANVHFVFAGEWYRPEEMHEAAELVGTLGVGSHVKFAGIAGPAAKSKLLTTADVFVLPSYNEGQPCAILEAMSAGLPIISTNVGCIAETVIEDLNGFLVETGNPEAIAQSILLLQDDPTRRYRMAVASRERFLANYTVEKLVDRLAHVLTDGKNNVVLAERQQESALP